MVQIVYPKGQTRKEPSLDIQVWYVNGADHLPQRTDKKRTQPGHSGMVCEWCRSFTPKDRQEKNPAWTFRYGMRMVQIVYPKGQTRKEPSLDIQVWYVNGADRSPQRTDKKRT